MSAQVRGDESGLRQLMPSQVRPAPAVSGQTVQSQDERALLGTETVDVGVVHPPIVPVCPAPG